MVRGFLFAGAIAAPVWLALTAFRIATKIDPWSEGHLVFGAAHFATGAVAGTGLVAYGLIGTKGSFGRLLESRVMVLIGKISYGLYVYHLFILRPALAGGASVHSALVALGGGRTGDRIEFRGGNRFMARARETDSPSKATFHLPNACDTGTRGTGRCRSKRPPNDFPLVPGRHAYRHVYTAFDINQWFDSAPKALANEKEHRASPACTRSEPTGQSSVIAAIFSSVASDECSRMLYSDPSQSSFSKAQSLMPHVAKRSLRLTVSTCCSAEN